MADAKPVGRPMVYPYTLSAKIAQFPLKYHINNSWLWKYWGIGILLSIPVFAKISSLANSPANVRNFEEARRKEEAEHHH